MKKVVATIAFGIFSFCAARAQVQDGRPFNLNVGADLALPLGTLGDVQGMGIGASAKASYKFFNQGAATLTAGYLDFMGKTVQYSTLTTKTKSVGYMPVKAGFKYSLGPTYIEPELGVAHFTGGGGTGVAYAGLFGFKVKMLDVSVRYEGISKNGTSSFIGLRIAYCIL